MARFPRGRVAGEGTRGRAFVVSAGSLMSWLLTGGRADGAVPVGALPGGAAPDGRTGGGLGAAWTGAGVSDFSGSGGASGAFQG